jgi:hypothetical protein
MRHTTTINGHHGNHYVEAAAFWILAGIIVVMAFGDFLTVLAGAFAIAIAITWVYRAVERRLERKNDAETASVRHLRPLSSGQRDMEETPAPASWRGPRAA